MKYRLVLFVGWALFVSVAHAMEIETVTPDVWAPGKTTEVTLAGTGLTAGKKLKLWASFPVNAMEIISIDPLTMRVSVDDLAVPGAGWIRVVHEHGASPFRRIVLDSMEGITSTNQGSLASPQPLDWPCVVTAHSLTLQSQFYEIHGKAGQRVVFDVWGERLGSEMDAVLVLRDRHGVELAFADNHPATGADCQLAYVLPNDGPVVIECHDVEHRGDLPYRLRIGDFELASAAYQETTSPMEQEPNDNLRQANPIELTETIRGRFRFPGDRDVFRFQSLAETSLTVEPKSRSLGAPGFVHLQLLNADGKTLAESGLGDQAEEALYHRLEHNGQYYLSARDLLGGGSSQHLYTLTLSTNQSPHKFSLANDRDDRPPKTLALIPGGILRVRVGLSPKDEAQLSARIGGKSLEVSPSTYPKGKKEVLTTIALPDDLQPGSLVPLEIFATTGTGDQEYATGLDVSPQYPVFGEWPQYWQLPVVQTPLRMGELPKVLEANPGDTITLEIPLDCPTSNPMDNVTLQVEPTPKGCAPPVAVTLGQPIAKATLTLESSGEKSEGDTLVRVWAKVETLGQTVELRSEPVLIRFHQP